MLFSSELALSSPGHFSQIKFDSQTKAATITLSDCLACSGCVTSAETVLITQQSSTELLSVLALKAAGPKNIFVVTLSPQTRASIAHHFGLSLLEAAKKISSFLRLLGVDYVMDSGAAMEIAQAESCEEFISRYSAHHVQKDDQMARVSVASAQNSHVCLIFA